MVCDCAEGEAHAVPGCPLYVRRVAGLAKAGDMHNDESRVNLPHKFVGDAPLLPLPALGALNKNVDILYKLIEYLLTVRCGHIYGYASLIAVILLEDIVRCT